MNPLKRFTVIAIVGLLFVGGYYGYLGLRSYQKNNTWQINYESGKDLHYKGNPDAAAKAFAKAVASAPTADEAGRAKIKLAFQMFVRNQGDDRLEAAKLYKQVIFDTSVNSITRAHAAYEMADIYGSLERNRDLLKQAVFNEKPYSEMLEGSDTSLAIRRAYEFSDEIYRLPLTEFVIGRMHMLPYLRGEIVTPAQLKDMTRQLNEWTTRGEAILEGSLQFYDDNMKAETLRSNGISRALLASLTDKNYGKAVQLYQRALELVAPESEFWAYSEGLQIRWNYASLLAVLYGKDAKSDIDRLLEPLYQPPEQFKNRTLIIHEYLAEESGAEHTTHLHRKSIIRTKETSQKLNQYLESQGWNYEM